VYSVSIQNESGRLAGFVLSGTEWYEAFGDSIEDHDLYYRAVFGVAEVDVPVLGRLTDNLLVAQTQLQNVVLRVIECPHDSPL